MKRLALVLAAAVLGTGCLVVEDDTCAPSTLTLSWDFQRWDGAILNCATADVQWVDVFMNGNLVGSGSPCTDGYLVVTGVPAATHSFTVEGIDFGGRIAYREELTAQSSGCGDRFVATRPAEGRANLNYTTATGCTSGTCYLWFAVQDTIANTVAAAISTTSPDAVKTTFPYPQDVVIRLAAGTYQLDWMQLVTSSYLEEGITCSPASFSVAPSGLTDVSAPLACVTP